MDDVKCLGTEQSLDECPHNSQHDCKGEEGAGAVCYGMADVLCLIIKERNMRFINNFICRAILFCNDDVIKIQSIFVDLVVY